MFKRKTSLFKAGENGIRIRAPSRKRAGRKAYKKERDPGRIMGGSKRKIGISHRRAKRMAMADVADWNRPMVPTKTMTRAILFALLWLIPILRLLRSEEHTSE